MCGRIEASFALCDRADAVRRRAAAAAYRARSTGSLADLDTLTELAPQVPEPYRRTLIDYVWDI
ncbi:hypothetical protein [Micromonospora sp. IBSANI012]|uniref:hypothetical protein n=1 Tax=Micromonospora sp. IBSANI012 TaxID=3457761 RepID=UPI004059C30E